MQFNDAVIGAVLLVFAIAEISYTTTFPSLHGQAYGPNLFPVLIGIGLGGCGLILIMRGLWARKHSTDGPWWFKAGAWAENPSALTNLLLVVLCMLVYILFSQKIGFILLSLATVFLLLHRLGSSPTVAVLIAVCTTALLQFLFARILLVPLPPGLLKGLVW